MSYLARAARRVAGSAELPAATPRHEPGAVKPVIPSRSPVADADQRLRLPELAAIPAVGVSGFTDETPFTAEGDGFEAPAAAAPPVHPRAMAPGFEHARPAEPTVAGTPQPIPALTRRAPPEIATPLLAGEPRSVDAPPYTATTTAPVERHAPAPHPIRTPPAATVPTALEREREPVVESLTPRAPLPTLDPGAARTPAAPPLTAQLGIDLPPSWAESLRLAESWLRSSPVVPQAAAVRPSAVTSSPALSGAQGGGAALAGEPDPETAATGLTIGEIRVEIVAPPAVAQRIEAPRPRARTARTERAGAPSPPRSFGWRQR